MYITDDYLTDERQFVIVFIGSRILYIARNANQSHQSQRKYSILNIIITI